MVIVEVAGQKYSIDKNLYIKWEKIKDGGLAKIDDDKVYVIDGRERSGKSVFTMQQAGAIDPSIFDEAVATGRLDRICFTGDELLKAIRNTKSDKRHTKVVIFDEAFRGLASSSVLSKTNRLIVQALMEMGQNNLVLFIVLPSFFLLDRYPAILRSNALFHIKKSIKSNRRKFYIYNFNTKARLYNMDRQKAWGYPIKSRRSGNFYNKYPGGKVFEEMYRAKKLKAFREIEGKLIGETEETKHVIQRNLLILRLKEIFNDKLVEMQRWFALYDAKLGDSALTEGLKSAKKRIREMKTLPVSVETFK
jgi:hypothetical protein